MILKRTSTRDVSFDGRRVSIVRLKDGAPEASFELPDEETKAALVAALIEKEPEPAPEVAKTTTKKRTTKKTSTETPKEEIKDEQ